MTVKTTLTTKSFNTGQKESDLPQISQPALRALAGAGVYRLEQLTRFRAEELKQLHGMGPKALGILREALAERGLAFAGERKAIA